MKRRSEIEETTPRKKPNVSLGGKSLPDVKVTCVAPVNIAVVKYWGKRCKKLNLPENSSISVTIDPGSMCSTTTVTASVNFDRHQMWLNDREEKMENPRVQKVLTEMIKRAQPRKNEVVDVVIEAEDWSQYKLHIDSHNNFPTAAGLASSASGYACLAKALSALFAVKETFEGELTTITRQGSGSACRSLFDGFAAWEKGQLEDGTDSIALPVAPAGHWPNVRILIAVADHRQKEVGSTVAMDRTTKTSQLQEARVALIEKRRQDMEQAIRDRDFPRFAEITMRDSNQFHAVCLDSFPPVFYLNATSQWIMKLIHLVNEAAGHIVAAYTFDAGPNAVIFSTEPYFSVILTLIKAYCPSSPIQDQLSLLNPALLSHLDGTPTGIPPAVPSSTSTSSSTLSLAEVAAAQLVNQVKQLLGPCPPASSIPSSSPASFSQPPTTGSAPSVSTLIVTRPGVGAYIVSNEMPAE